MSRPPDVTPGPAARNPDGAGAGTAAEIVVSSNRGPVTFVTDESGRVVPSRGAGGLVTALTGALQVSGGLWIAAAMSDEDRAQARRGRFALEADGDGSSYDVRYLEFDPGDYDRFYNGVSNRVLWFVHHLLWDVPRSPVFDESTRADWDAYRRVNQAFADALCDEDASAEGAVLHLVQDYHLSLVPAMLRERRPRARIAHFSHIPFAGPRYFGILPGDIQTELLCGLLGADVVGFHASRWADAFLDCCARLDDARVHRAERRVEWRGRDVAVRIYPISIDVESLRRDAARPEVTRARRWLARLRGDGKLIVRVDRTDLSKNILRGFLAFGDFLRRYPQWRRRVRFFAQMNPSREAIPEYADYIGECVQAAERINRQFGTGEWEPIELSLKDDFITTLAAYAEYDALLVNPVFDGMNLVAKEGPVLNRRAGVLVLSENAGAAAELGRDAICVNPFDVQATADALNTALEMEEDERIRRIRRLRAAVRGNTLERWVSAQLDDLERVPAAR